MGSVLTELIARIRSYWGRPPSRIKPVDVSSRGQRRQRVQLMDGEHIDVGDDLGKWLTADRHGFVQYGLRYILYPSKVGMSSSSNKYHLTRCRAFEAQIESEKTFGNRYKVARELPLDLRFAVTICRFPGTKRETVLGSAHRSFTPCHECLYDLGLVKRGSGLGHRWRIKKFADEFDVWAYLGISRSQNSRTPSPTGHADSAIMPEPSDLSGHRDDRTPFFRAVKRFHNFICQGCGVDLKADPQFLSIHHKDRNKRNDVIDNFEILCLRCHSNRPGIGHQRLRETEDYRRFVAKY